MKKCEKCGIKDKRVLITHHKNKNREDNRLENLQTLCRNCHAIEHYNIRLKFKNSKHTISHLENDKIEILFKQPLKNFKFLLIALGFRKGNKVLVNQENQTCVGVHCSAQDWYDLIKNVKSPEKVSNDFKNIVNGFGIDLKEG